MEPGDWTGNRDPERTSLTTLCLSNTAATPAWSSLFPPHISSMGHSRFCQVRPTFTWVSFQLAFSRSIECTSFYFNMKLSTHPSLGLSGQVVSGDACAGTTTRTITNKLKASTRSTRSPSIPPDLCCMPLQATLSAHGTSTGAEFIPKSISIYWWIQKPTSERAVQSS